jgi:hypothetical protein
VAPSSVDSRQLSAPALACRADPLERPEAFDTLAPQRQHLIVESGGASIAGWYFAWHDGQVNVLGSMATT